MQANELRIGNWVSQGGVPVRVDFNAIRLACLLTKNTYEGIPITPGILRKSGFEERGKEWNFNVNCFEWHKDKFYYSAGEGLELSRNIRFVHELQNFYFALTGEELQIKL